MLLAPFVRINYYPKDNAIGFCNSYPLDNAVYPVDSAIQLSNNRGLNDTEI